MRRIDFFIEESKTYSDKEVFGVCDDENKLPAYIDEDLTNKKEKWIGQVKNDGLKTVNFYPVDNCVEIVEDDGKMAKRCDGILNYDKTLVFTELKNQKFISPHWRSEAEEQIIETMTFFFDNYDAKAYKTKAWICNKRMTNQNFFQQIINFRERTKNLFGNRGCYLNICNSLSV